MKLLTWLDWFNVIRLLPIASEEVNSLAPELSREQLLEAIHCVTPEAEVHRGARCIRFVGMRMPLIIPIALVLWIPGVIHLAERVYQWISRNRHLLSRVFGCQEACAMMPSRHRDEDDLPGRSSDSS